MKNKNPFRIRGPEGRWTLRDMIIYRRTGHVSPRVMQKRLPNFTREDLEVFEKFYGRFFEGFKKR